MAYIYRGDKLIAAGGLSQKDFQRIAYQLNVDPKLLRIEYTKQEQIEKRVTAYKVESDSLYLQWQFDQTAEAEQVWRDKVAEIKARYPLPSNG